MKPLDDDELPTDSLTRELQRLTEKFLDDQVSASNVKVERILNGNIRQGFHGHKSHMVPSESGSQPHVIKCVDEHKYVCCTPCLQIRCTIYAAFRSPLMKAVERSVKTLGL